LKTLKGPLTFGIEGHNIDHFAKRRVKLIFQEVVGKDLYVGQNPHAASRQEQVLAKL
jgi:hypothetical protein